MSRADDSGIAASTRRTATTGIGSRPAVVRFEAVEPHCLDCESPLSLGDGPNVAHTYDFAAREIAAALVAVANGATYSQASLGARGFPLRHHAGPRGG